MSDNNKNIEADLLEDIELKHLFFQLISYWRLYMLTIIVALFVVFMINRYSTKIYKLSSVINIKESENPLASSNVSLMFKWGGTSELLQAQIAILKSRTHAKKVIERLNLEVEYYSTGRIKMFTRYGETPFRIEFDRSHDQVLNLPLEIVLSSDMKKCEIKHEQLDGYLLYNYETKEKHNTLNINLGGEYELGNWVESEEYKFKVFAVNLEDKFDGSEVDWYFQFRSPVSLVSHYSKAIEVIEKGDGSSLLTISMIGDSKVKIVDYLNTSISILMEFELAQKNQLALNTTKFVEMQIQGVVDSLRAVESELENFRVDNQDVNIGRESSLFEGYLDIETQKAEVLLTNKYYNYLINYLQNGDEFTGVMSPSVAGINDPVLVKLVGNLVELSIKKNGMMYSLQGNNPALEQVTSEIGVTRNSLLENVKNLVSATKIRSDEITNRLDLLKSKLAVLPKAEQRLINIERKYRISSSQYDFLVAKRAEAQLAMAGNLPDLQVIDQALDYGDKPIKPKTFFNYIIGLIIGLAIPTLFVLIRSIFNTKIGSRRELEKATSIPVIGSIGHSSGSSNIVIQNSLKSSVAESFRIIRTNLKFIFKQDEEGDLLKSKVVLVTSSIGGEGKTFCAINLASIIAIGGSRTVIIGFDLRKPKIFNDFKLTNEVGLSDYLVGEVSLNEVICNTEVNNLDFITAGPVPPNPSELLLSPKMTKLFLELRKSYDYIILDTPPIVLVSDAMELMKYADATLYIARQNYTNSNLLDTINLQHSERGLKNISIIFNDVVSSGYGYGYNYGYNYGYGYGYGYGYYDEDEVKVPWWKKII